MSQLHFLTNFDGGYITVSACQITTITLISQFKNNLNHTDNLFNNENYLRKYLLKINVWCDVGGESSGTTGGATVAILCPSSPNRSGPQVSGYTWRPDLQFVEGKQRLLLLLSYFKFTLI